MALTKVTTGTIASETIKSANIEDGTIVNADVNASAAIVATKLSGVESGLTSVQTFTSSGTWTRPSGITKVIVEVQGGGSSGRADGTYPRGAGGAYAKKLIDVSSISTATVTVGAGGAAQSAGGGNGNAGGNSIWSDGTNTVTGGGGSAHGTVGTFGAAGGVSSGGDLNINGQGSGITGGGAGNGNSFLGYSDWCYGSLTGSDQEPIPGYGGGGGHGYTSYPSRVGGPGIVIVTEYK